MGVPEQPSGLCAAKWKGGQICCEKSNGDFSCYTEAKCGQKYGTVETDETKCVPAAAPAQAAAKPSAQTTKAVPEQPSGLCAAKWKGGQICCEKSNGDFSCYTEAK